jgi:hypothetical protein
MAWTKRLADRLMQRHMGHVDLEFAWQTLDPLDPEDEATMLVGLVKEGIMTRNEARVIRGMEPVDGGDELIIDAGANAVRVQDIANPPEPVVTGTDQAPGIQGSSQPRAASRGPVAADTEEEPAGKAATPPRQARTAARRPDAQPGADAAMRDAIAREAVELLRATRGRGRGADRGADRVRLGQPRQGAAGAA